MPSRAVLVSDLHLSTHPALDDFTRDDDLDALVELPELRPEAGAVDLVLLGDTFDLWQSVDDAECLAAQASRIDLRYDAASELRRLAETAARHPRCFSALARFTRRNGARVVFVTGNHDHALVVPAVQDAVRALLRVPSGSPSVAFQPFYEDARLSLYADHGSQYDRNNALKDFSAFDWAHDSAGYYFVKLFFNRIERRDPRLENSPSGWAGVWHWLRRVANLPLLADAIRWFAQYWSDRRVPQRLVLTRARTGPGRPLPDVVDIPSGPLLLVDPGDGAGPKRAGPGASFFSEDPVMEEFYREAYQASEEVRIAVNEILEARAPAGRARKRSAPGRRDRTELGERRKEVPPPTGKRIARPRRTRGADRPADVKWAEKLYTDKPWFRERLSSETRFVVFGHTHDEGSWTLSNGATYLNTGSWTAARGPLPVVIAEGAAAAPAARLVHLSNGVLV